MKLKLSTLLLGVVVNTTLIASPQNQITPSVTVVKVPYISRETNHVDYVHKLMELALDKTKAEFGDYRIQYHDTETLPERQLRGLEEGEQVSVTFSHAKAKWDNAAIRVPFPLAKGLGSYRFFFTLPKHLPSLEKVDSLDDFYQFIFGQGLGWSTASILEDHQFRVEYSSRYVGLFIMLESERFDLLMRGAFEILGEEQHLKTEHPSITYSPDIAMLTLLPMYFYVSDTQPELAIRLERGLKIAFESGEFDELFTLYFQDAVQFVNSPTLRSFWIDNRNVSAEQFYEIKPYLLPELIEKIEPNIQPKL
ncbi:hypothetical protein D210916BOD24_30280 [Alteromonas sp. D210916BOD_24]|uniref:hypothetical protein n=1 Tax=Alteromonas sp. D210916BOD_24 TaxID=3157618 RepID=UPI00399C7C70